jgi:chromosome segregation ATPase
LTDFGWQLTQLQADQKAAATVKVEPSLRLAEVEEIKRRLAATEEELKQNEVCIADKDNCIKDLKMKLQEAHMELKTCQDSIKSLRNEKDYLASKLADKNKSFNEALKRELMKSKLRENNSKMQELESSHSTNTESVMKQIQEDTEVILKRLQKLESICTQPESETLKVCKTSLPGQLDPLNVYFVTIYTT